DFVGGEVVEAAAGGFFAEPAAVAHHLEAVPEDAMGAADAEGAAEGLPEEAPEAWVGDVDRENELAARLEDAGKLFEETVVGGVGIGAGLRVLRLGVGDAEAGDDAVEGGGVKLRQAVADVAGREEELTGARGGV